MMEVLLRRDEIVYSERIRNAVRTRNLVHDFHKLVEEILEEVTPDKLMQIKQRPRYIQPMGDVAPIAITRIVREVVEDEPLSKDYDFPRCRSNSIKEAATTWPNRRSAVRRVDGFFKFGRLYAGVF